MGSQFSINERIRKISDFFFSGNTSAMARETSIKQATLRDIISEKVKPSYDTINAIIENSTLNINSEWLITGKGSMLKSEQISSIVERLKHFIEEQGITEIEFCETIDMPYVFYTEMKGAIPEKHLKNITVKYPDLSIAWLMAGEGSMLRAGSAKIPEQDIPNDGNAKKSSTIKYFPSVNGSMGGIEFLDNPDEFYTDIILPGFGECKFAVNAFGDSMYPVIKSGQIVIMMPWVERFIDWGHIYMVVTKSGYRAIKYLRPSMKEGYVTCESENKENNPSFDIEMEDIHKLYLVKGWICRDAI